MSNSREQAEWLKNEGWKEGEGRQLGKRSAYVRRYRDRNENGDKRDINATVGKKRN